MVGGGIGDIAFIYFFIQYLINLISNLFNIWRIIFYITTHDNGDILEKRVVTSLITIPTSRHDIARPWLSSPKLESEIFLTRTYRSGSISQTARLQQRFAGVFFWQRIPF